MGPFTQVGRELHYKDKPANLAGVIAGKDNYTTTDKLVRPFSDDMPRLASFNNNFFRHWLVPYWNYSPKNKVNPVNCIFKSDANNKWRLTSPYNQDYFVRLNEMIVEAGRQHIAVQLVLFDRSGLDTTMPSEAPVKRWDDNPWNAANNIHGVVTADPTGSASGLPEFYRNYIPAIGNLQKAWIENVVGQTKNNWNVFYEIMNEPMHGSINDRINWADWVVGIIHGVTNGSRLIFYNDHTGGARGQDVNAWKQSTTLANYDKFHGVIFHGRPTDYVPADPPYKFLNDKILQVSSDGGPTGIRDTFQTNKEWCAHAFAHKMMFQAHTISTEAARGIGWNNPTPLR
jgi:hypothetical protein